MADWPTIIGPDYGSGGELYKPQIATETDANYRQVRSKFTRHTFKWPLRWGMMSEEDFATLQQFFIDNVGLTFNWWEPETGTAYTCTFLEDSLKWSWNQYGTREVSCLIGSV